MQDSYLGKDIVLQVSNMVKIVDAAIKYKGTTYTGTRHAHILQRMATFGDISIKNKPKLEDQGFLTDDNIFVDGETAKILAIQSGQIDENFKGTLHSEDLW